MEHSVGMCAVSVAWPDLGAPFAGRHALLRVNSHRQTISFGVPIRLLVGNLLVLFAACRHVCGRFKDASHHGFH